MTIVRGRITGAHRNEEKTEHKLFIRLLPEDGAAGDVTVDVSPAEYEKFAKNFTQVFEVEVNLCFDKTPTT